MENDNCEYPSGCPYAHELDMDTPEREVPPFPSFRGISPDNADTQFGHAFLEFLMDALETFRSQQESPSTERAKINCCLNFWDTVKDALVCAVVLDDSRQVTITFTDGKLEFSDGTPSIDVTNYSVFLRGKHFKEMIQKKAGLTIANFLREEIEQHSEHHWSIPPTPPTDTDGED